MTRFFLPLVIVTCHLLCTQMLCEQQAFQFFRSVEVHIISGVPNTPKPLRFRCQSKDDDLGEHTLNTGQEFNWKFSPNILGTTLFFCHFYWNSKDRSFAVYDDRLRDLCSDSFKSQCYWVAKPDGFYLSKDNKSIGRKINNWT